MKHIRKKRREKRKKMKNKAYEEHLWEQYFKYLDDEDDTMAKCGYCISWEVKEICNWNGKCINKKSKRYKQKITSGHCEACNKYEERPSRP